MARIGNWLTLRTVWLVLVSWGLFMRLLLSSIPPNDFWWHVRVGRIIVETGAIPTTDLFSFTRLGETWVNQAWLMQVWLAWQFMLGGAPLVILVHAVTITLGYTLVLTVCVPRYGVRISAWAMLLGMLVGLQGWAIRPQSISYLAFGLLIVLIELHRRGHRRVLWGVVPLFALWGNLHGAFVFGVALLGLYVVGTLWTAAWDGSWRTQRGALLLLCAQGLAALAALTLNPQGFWGMVDYVAGFFQSDATLQRNVEFAPLTLRNPDGVLFALATLLLVGARLRSGLQLHAAQTLWVLCFGVLALLSMRGASWYGMLLIPILAEQFRAWWSAPRALPPGVPWANGLLLGVFALLLVVTNPWVRPAIPSLAARYPLLSEDTPVAATEFLCPRVPPGTHGYQHFAFSSYLIDQCPALPVMVDTRIELYPTEVWDEYFDIHHGRYNWADLAARYEIRYLMLHLEEQPYAIAAATAHPDWREVYRDDRAVIFVARGLTLRE